MNVQSMESLLLHALSPDTGVRVAAENTIQRALKNQPQMMLQLLPHVLCVSQNIGVRSLAAVVLRKYFESLALALSDDLTNTPVSSPNLNALENEEKVQFDPKTLFTQLSSHLISAIVKESTRNVRLIIADTFAELASTALYEAHWSEETISGEASDVERNVLRPIFELSSSNNLDFKEISAIIVYKLADCVCDILPGHVEFIFKNIVGPLLSFSDGGNDLKNAFYVQVASLKATGSLITSIISVDDARRFFNLYFPQMMKICNNAIQLLHTDSCFFSFLEEILNVFCEIATADPRFFKDSWEELCVFLVQFSQNSVIEKELRHLALECLVTVCEGAPSMVRRSKNSIQSIIFSAFLLIILGSEEDDLIESIKSAEAEDDLNSYDYAEEMFDRVARSLGGSAVSEIYLPFLQQFMESNEWKHRNAALVSFSQVAETLTYEAVSEVVRRYIVAFLNDSNCRVQFSALTCIGQISSDFGGKFQEDFHSLIIPCFIRMMNPQTSTFAKIQAQAAAALINFAEQCPAAIIVQYLDPLLSLLFERLQNGHYVVQEQAITAIASIADSSKSHFAPFYHIFIPIVKHIIALCFPFSHENLPTISNLKKFNRQMMFRGRALECFSFVVNSVGNSVDLNDLHDIMKLVLQQEKLIIETAKKFASSKNSFEEFFFENASLAYMFQAFIRLFGAMRDDLFIYINEVLEFALVTLSLGADTENPTFSTPGTIDFDLENAPASHLGSINEISSAMSLVSTLIYLFNNRIAIYLENLVDVLTPLLTFTRCDAIRKSSIGCLPNILAIAYQTKSAEFFKELYLHVFDSLISASAHEYDIYIQMHIMHIFKIVFDMKSSKGQAFNFSIDDSRVSHFISSIFSFISSSSVRQLHRHNKRLENDLDPADIESSKKEDSTEEQFCYRLFECSRSGVKCMLENLSDVLRVDGIGKIVSTLQSATLVSKRITCLLLSVFAECLREIFGEYFPVLLPMLASFVSKREGSGNLAIDFQRSVVFSLGSFALFCPQSYRKYSAQLCSLLINLLNSTSTENTILSNVLRDSCVSAIGKIALNAYFEPDKDVLIKYWLQCLPLHVDALEAISCYRYLCNAVETNDVHVIGSKMENLPLIVKILLSVINLSYIPKDLCISMRSLLLKIHNSEVRALCFNDLTPEHHSILLSALDTSV